MRFKKNELFLQNILDAIQDGISVMDRDLNILWANPSMQEKYIRSESFEGKKCYQACHRRKEPCEVCPSIRALESHNLEIDVVPWVVSRKTERWLELCAFPILDSTGKPSGVVESVRNVLDRTNAEQAFRVNELKFRRVADFSYNWEFWLAPDGNYLHVSPSCERITGYPSNEFLKDANLLENIVHPEDHALVVRHLKEDLNCKETKAFEFRIAARNGRQVWIDHISLPVYNSQGSHLGRRGSHRDITERKRAEKALREAYKSLERQVEVRTSQLENANKKLESNQKELFLNKSKLEKLNMELLETNQAVTFLAKNLDKNRQKTEYTIAKTINSKIMPIVEKLRKGKNLSNLQSELDILALNLQTMTNDLTGGVNLMATLSPTEQRVCTLIKNGLKSQEIADKLYISLHTAKTHRKNIRKKLNVNNSRINLASYLQSIMW